MGYKDYQPDEKGSGFYKFKDGENKLRFVTDAVPFTGYDQKGVAKQRFVAFVIDRADGGVKPCTFGRSIMGQVARLARSTESGFENLPPYDFIISKSGDGLNTEYIVLPSRKDTPLTAEEENAVYAQNDINDIARKLQEREDKRKAEMEVNEA